ncbi:hypothetical protein LOC67_14400 [Stieleria sp. JC731]|uniref:hypothetical protein n=1 Tax=Pirellulaceae TaxID=2691357 RepID=UPI001E63693F|nr:hypothetical protein [Stieleria sp. JC731]MCC9601747.1 hypothetical protein [Stieleria sp. JC731]
MATTLATEKQAEAIKHRMQEIRTNLPYEVDQARDQVKELSDWKYHFRRHPAAMMGVAAAFGFMLIPSRPSPRKQVVIERHPLPRDQHSEPAKKGLIGGLVGAVATIAIRQAVSMAATHVSSVLSNNSRSGR